MKIKFILKRDGRSQKYDRDKIAMATWQSLWAVSQVRKKFPQIIDINEIARRAAEIEVPHEKANRKSSLWKEANRLAKIVETTLACSNPPRLASGEAGGSHQWRVEEIQDIREQTLMAAGREAEAKAYIFYRNRKASTRQSRQGSDLLKRSDPAFLGMSPNAYAAMAKRYLWKDKDGNVVETPREAIQRVAITVANVENEQTNKSASRRTNEQKNNQTIKSKNKYWRDRYLEIMMGFEFVPAGCYFRGAGNKQNGSLANCFVLPVEDSIEKIFDAVKWAALIHQMGGGTGFNFSHLRPRGDVVKSGGLASGPINFMKAFDAETQIVMQGGEHRGANMGILNVDHPDIFEFIRAKSIDGEVSNFNISVGAFDKFMQAVDRGNDWPLTNPRDKSIVQKIPARQLWEEIISLAHKTGDPGMIYLDAVNRANPVLKSLGPIESTNVCGEQPLHPFDVCNLGSINLSKFVIRPWWEGKSSSRGVPMQLGRRGDLEIATLPASRRVARNDINWTRLEEVIRTAVRFLDDGIDASTYPIPQIDDMARKLRRIGLGIMGWADMLVKLGIRYDSDEGIKLAESIMKFIQEISWDESCKISKEKGVFSLWDESYFNTKNNPFGKVRKVRNVAVTTIAPTGTISMIADCSSGIEPYFALEYTKNVVEKQGLKYTNKYYEDAKKAIVKNSHTTIDDSRWKVGVENRRLKMEKSDPSSIIHPLPQSSIFHHPLSLEYIFRTAHDISPDWHVRMQAAFQKYTDNAVSKTINFSREATIKDIERAYLLAWKLGCKGITVYRDGSREGQILKEMTNDELRMTNAIQHSLPALPTAKPLQAGTFNIQHSHTQRLMQSQMTVTPLSQRAYKYERQQIVEESTDGHCPECGAVMIFESGCSTCHSCGYSRCSL